MVEKRNLKVCIYLALFKIRTLVYFTAQSVHKQIWEHLGYLLIGKGWRGVQPVSPLQASPLMCALVWISPVNSSLSNCDFFHFDQI